MLNFPLYIPLVVAFFLGILVLIIPYTPRLEWVFSVFARGLFAARVDAPQSNLQQERKHLLQAAQSPSTYRSYAARTYLYSAIYGIIGSILGVYLFAGVLGFFSIPQETLEEVLPSALQFLSTISAVPSISLSQLLVLILASGSTLGVLFSYTTYHLRWWLLQNRANIRGRHIDKTLPAIVAFMYAMSRKGIPFSEIVHTLADNKDAYGAAAEDVENVSRDINLYGEDLNNALRRMARRTPSHQFEEFTHNLISVLQSRQNISIFLRNQYERYQEDLESQQSQFLSTLATLAEIYVSIFVVGFLLLITILVIVGLFGVGDTFSLVQALVYIVIPLLNFMFILYLDSILKTEHRSFIERDRSIVQAGLRNIRRSNDNSIKSPVVPDEDSIESVRKRLQLYHRIKAFKTSVLSPKRTLTQSPAKIFYITAPIATLIVFSTLWPYQDTILNALQANGQFSWSDEGLELLAAIDSTIILTIAGLLGSYAFVYQLHIRRIHQIDDSVADFLDRLASVNEAGMTVVEALNRLNQSTNDLGVLSVEIERTCRDIDWGADATTALYNLEQRAKTATITRVVTLITNALRASGSISPILRIAADEANNIRRLREERQREMFTYQIVIYMAFFVFMIIIASLTEILIPGMPEVDESLTIFSTSGSSGVGAAAYTLLLYHTSITQAIFAGLIAGQMGEGSIKAGTKHATILVLFTYTIFLLLL